MNVTQNGVALATRVQHAPDVVRRSPTVEFVAHLDEHWRLAQILVKSGIVPARTPEAAMAIMLKAHELGIPAMHAFANLHYFDGKLVESAQLMVGMAAERCGVTYEVDEWTDTKCRLLFHRPGWSRPLPSEFTIEDAKRAKLLNKDNWVKFPKAMLLARAQAQGVRAIAPDRFAGMYSVEEMRDTETAPPVHTQIHEVARALDTDDEDDVTDLPEPEDEPEENDELFDAEPEADEPEEPETGTAIAKAMDELTEIVGTMKPKGGDASKLQRERINEAALRVAEPDSFLLAGLVHLANAPDLGRGQAGIIVSKLKSILELIAGQGTIL